MTVLACFTWRGVVMFYSGDDMTNTYRAWDLNLRQLAAAQLLPWVPVYRPVGDAIYRVFYAAFGFHPEPLYLFCWLLLPVNVILAYLFFHKLLDTAWALTATALVLVHGSFGDLYYSAGTIYDRLCFLFTVAALITYFRFRQGSPWWSGALICLFFILAMGSKESGVTLFPILACTEVLFFLPGVWTRRTLSSDMRLSEMRRIFPLFAALAALSLLFLFGRLYRTQEILRNPDYAPHFNIGIWLKNVSEYIGILMYRSGNFGPHTAVIVLAAMATAALILRNRAMLLGWLFFVISVTPVALIRPRTGYVLYLPCLGLGLFTAAMIARLTELVTRRYRHGGAIIFALVLAALTGIHIKHWPAAWLPSAEWRLTQQFRREYPKMPVQSKLLFVSDDFPPAAYDLLFNLRLLYHDKTIVAYRLKGIPEQRPDPQRPPVYDHIFTAEGGRYLELDLRDPEESIRLHILRNYTVGSEVDMRRADRSAYAVFGLKDEDSAEPSRWLASTAQFKFRPAAGSRFFTIKFWVPDFVAKPQSRTLMILVNGTQIGSVRLTKEGTNQDTFAIPATLLRKEGFTLVDINVSNPYKDAEGNDYGVILFRMGFRQTPPAGEAQELPDNVPFSETELPCLPFSWICPLFLLAAIPRLLAGQCAAMCFREQLRSSHRLRNIGVRITTQANLTFFKDRSRFYEQRYSV